MQKKLINVYVNSAGALLLALALMLLLGSLSSIGLAQPQDPVLIVSLRGLSLLFGVTASVIALLCLFGKNVSLKLFLLFWLGAVAMTFQLASYFLTNQPSVSGYLGVLEETFHISANYADLIVKLTTGYLLCSPLLSLWLWVTAKDTLQSSCPSCGGRVRFSIKAVGSNMPCPHCKNNLTLYDSEFLKMSCFFCHGHIEFPAYALGRKLRCPHCHMDITLKETATI